MHELNQSLHSYTDIKVFGLEKENDLERFRVIFLSRRAEIYDVECLRVAN